MHEDPQDTKYGPLKQLPATRPGERVLRRLKKPKGKFRATLEGIRGRFKGMTRKYLGIR